MLLQRGKIKHLGPHFPTFIGHRSLTRPDIILTNTRAFHNYYIQQGPLTGSDHLPVIFTLSTSPIQVNIPPRLNTQAANWEEYQAYLQNYDVPILHNGTLEEIDEEVEKLQEKIKQAMNKFIPITQYKTAPHIKSSEYMRRLQTRFLAIHTHIQHHQATRDLILNINEIQEEIRAEGLRLQSET